MKSAYTGAQVVLKNGDPLEELRFGNQVALSANTGEINAYDKKDIMVQISRLMQAVTAGEVVPAAKALTQDEIRAKRREVLAAAYADTTGEKWAALGASVAMQVEQQRNREGFMRRLANGQTLRQGEVARIFMKTWDAVSFIATSSADIAPQLIRSNKFYPAEFEVTANLRVEQIEIEQVSSDILDHMYNIGLDSVMVQEDRLWKKAADLTVGVVNPMNYITGQLTPQTLATIRTTVSNWNLPVTTAVIANDFWSDITGNSEFSSFFDPITKYDLVMNGQLGTLVGLNLITDAFRQPNQKVLNRGEIYVVSDAEFHAAYTDRGGVRSTPTSGADQGNTTRGWLLSEIISFMLANPRSVAKGRRV